MHDRGKLRLGLVVTVLVAVLACPAWSAPAGAKKNHYPGQDCTKCHTVRPKPGERMPSRPNPPAGSPAGTGTTAPATTAPPQGAPRSR